MQAGNSRPVGSRSDLLWTGRYRMAERAGSLGNRPSSAPPAQQVNARICAGHRWLSADYIPSSSAALSALIFYPAL